MAEDIGIWVSIVLRWLHILSAIVLVGGIFFQRLAHLPAMELAPDDAQRSMRALVRRRWSPVVMATTGLLLVSGLVNYILTMMRAADGELAGYYHMAMGIKILLALPVLFIAAALAGRSPMAQWMQTRESIWNDVNLGLILAIVMIGGVLRYSH